MPAEILSVDEFDSRYKNLLKDMSEEARREINQIIETANFTYCITDYDTGKLSFRTSKYVDLFKFEMKHKRLDLYSFLDLVHRDDKEIYFELLEALRNKKRHKCRLRILMGNLGKTQLRFEITCIPTKGSQALLHFQNLTENITSQRKLLEQEIHYLKMFELSPFGIVIHDGGVVIYINKLGLKIIGAENYDEVIGKSIMSFVHPDYAHIVKERSRNIIEKREDVELIEEKFVRLDGKAIDVEVVGTPTYYKGRMYAQVLFRDITEKKRFQREIEFSEKRFRTVFENSPFIELILDKDYRPVSYNSVARQFFERNEVDLRESNFSDFLDEETAMKLNELSTENPVLRENNQKLKLTKEPICNITIIYIKSETEEYFVLIDDVTDLLKIQNELNIRNKINDIGLLASGLSHDFNNVLTSTLGYLELLKTTEFQIPDEAKKIIDQIEKANQRGKDLIKRLQGLSIDKRETEKYVHLDDIVAEVKKIVYPRLADISFIVSKKDNFPPIFAAYNDLFQLILNLVVNSIDALQNKEGEKWIEISYILNGSCILISVSDNGSGISESIKKEIFQPFFSTKSSTNQTRGLGLVTAQSIVSRMGGQISVHSEVGRGTTMLISLPISKDVKCYLQ